MTQRDPSVSLNGGATGRAEREWCGAIASLHCLLQKEITSGNKYPRQVSDTLLPYIGLVLSGPVPVLSHSDLVVNFSAVTFTCEPRKSAALLPGVGAKFFASTLNVPLSTGFGIGARKTPAPQVVPLLTGDPLTNEQFCVVLTSGFSLVMVKGEDGEGRVRFQFSFDPEVVGLVWEVLRSRVSLTDRGEQLRLLDTYFEQLAPVAPDYKTVMYFSQLLLEFMPDRVELESADYCQKSPRAIAPGEDDGGTPLSVGSGVVREKDIAGGEEIENKVRRAKEKLRIKNQEKFSILNSEFSIPLEQLTGANGKGVLNQTQAQDVELLQAIAHEVRTPLATIRTLTRLLLKRQNLDREIIKRLESIDRECSEQIDRFGLIFRAVELETSSEKRSPVQLTSTSLASVLSSCIPRWQKQASRRNLTLDVVVPQKMPPVVSDPTMLDQLLTGAIENFTSSLPVGSHIQVQVTIAGSQLKVQLHSQPNSDGGNGFLPSPVSKKSPLKSIGQMLMFQPETGNLSLNLSVTKNLFQALGGKLIVRQRPQQGEVLTIFLPLEVSCDTIISCQG